MNLKDRQEIRERAARRKRANSGEFQFDRELQIQNLKDTIEKLKQLLQEALQALQTMTERDDLLKIQAEDRKLFKEELEKQQTLNQNLENEKKILMEKEYLSRKELGVCQQEARKREEERKLDEQTHTRTRGRSR